MLRASLRDESLLTPRLAASAALPRPIAFSASSRARQEEELADSLSDANAAIDRVFAILGSAL
jgi:hypothetical protein